MGLVREIASLGRAARAAEKLKVRQPLARVEVILADAAPGDEAWLEAHAELVCDELNVKACQICRDPARYIVRSIQPDLKRLGPRLGRDLPQARQAIARADAAAVLAEIARQGRATVFWAGGTVVLEPDDLIVRTTAKPGWAAAEGRQAVVVVEKELTSGLVAEGLAREVIHAVQSLRKGLDLEFTDRIELVLATESAELGYALATHRDSIAAETLALGIDVQAPGQASAARTDAGPAPATTIDIDGHPLSVGLTVVAPRGGTA